MTAMRERARGSGSHDSGEPETVRPGCDENSQKAALSELARGRPGWNNLR